MSYSIGGTFLSTILDIRTLQSNHLTKDETKEACLCFLEEYVKFAMKARDFKSDLEKAGEDKAGSKEGENLQITHNGTSKASLVVSTPGGTCIRI